MTFPRPPPAPPPASNGFGMPRLPGLAQRWLEEEPPEGRFYVYGAGSHTHGLLDCLAASPQGTLLGLVDRRAAALGGVCFGAPVISPEALAERDFDQVLVSFDRDERELVAGLAAAGVSQEKIRVLYADPRLRARHGDACAAALLAAAGVDPAADNPAAPRPVVLSANGDPTVDPAALAGVVSGALAIIVHPTPPVVWPGPAIRLHPWEAGVIPALLRRLGPRPVYLSLGGRLAELATFDGFAAACRPTVVETPRLEIAGSGVVDYFPGLPAAPRVYDLGQVERDRFGAAQRDGGGALVWITDFTEIPADETVDEAARRRELIAVLSGLDGVSLDIIRPAALDPACERTPPVARLDLDGRVRDVTMTRNAARRLARLFDAGLIPPPPAGDSAASRTVSPAFALLAEAGLPLIVSAQWTAMAELTKAYGAGAVVDEWRSEALRPLFAAAGRDGWLASRREGAHRLYRHMLARNEQTLGRVAAALGKETGLFSAAGSGVMPGLHASFLRRPGIINSSAE